MKGSPLSRFRLANANRLRHDRTHYERLLWRHLKRIPLHGTHFRQQASIDRYVVDFVGHFAGLIVELDGDQHGFDKARAHDARRTAFLASQGYRVVRFWNTELHSNLEGILDTIYAALYGGLHAAPTLFERRRIHEISPSPGNEMTTAANVADHPTPTLRVDPPLPGEGEPP
jgi:very-short-patch-repair endonuclease